MTINAGVFGAAGHMGRMIVSAMAEHDEISLVGASEWAGSAAVGTDSGVLAGLDPNGISVSGDPSGALAGDVAIDFTRPDVTLQNAALARDAGVAMVIGTTGLSDAQDSALAEVATQIPIVYAPNMSVGVNLLLTLIERVAATLGPDAWDIEVVEMHHNRKVDAPSGTAIGLGKAAARGRDRSFNDVAVLSREGVTAPRQKGEIGFATLRGGDVVGEHSVIFAGDAERIEITHKASGRHIFANGAVRAAQWVVGKPPGLYGMADVLGL